MFETQIVTRLDAWTYEEFQKVLEGYENRDFTEKVGIMLEQHILSKFDT